MPPAGDPSSRDSPASLLDKLRSALIVRHYSLRTIEAYLAWVRRFIMFHGRQHPSRLAASHVLEFLTSLAEMDQLSAATQNQALAALVFFYAEVLGAPLAQLGGIPRARRPTRLPVVMTRGEIQKVLEQLNGVWLLMASLLYGSGLRLSECVGLRVKDVDLSTSQLMVRRGKGQKDRLAPLPRTLSSSLDEHLQRVRAQHAADLARGAGYVALPDALRSKYPNAAREWIWQWVFPATRTYVDPATGERRRHHIHETALQRAVKSAVARSGVAKLVSCHSSGTRSPRTCSSPATMCVRFRSSWGTRISARRWSTLTFCSGARSVSRVRSTVHAVRIDIKPSPPSSLPS